MVLRVADRRSSNQRLLNRQACDADDMKMLFVHDRIGAWAGAEANAHAAAREFKRRGHELGLLHGSGTGRAESDWRETFGGGCFSFVAPDKTGAVRQALDQFAPDLAYIHNLPDLEVLEALLNAQRPAVRMVHDHDLYCMRSYKYNCLTRRICTRRLSPYCLFPCLGSLKRNREGGFPFAWASYARKREELALNRGFRRLLVATQYMKEELLRNGFEASRVEVHPPVPPQTASQCCSTLSDRNLIVYAGQITRGKGVDVLLRSLARVRAPFECLIFGDGHYKAHCEQLSRRLGLDDRVRFLGFVSQAELKNFYRECRVAVLSSVWPEPFGAVGLEAMRCGVPVVGFDAGGVKEWLIDGYNGYLIPWMDHRAFADKVEALLRDRALARHMGENALQTANQRFDFSKYIDGLEGLFHRVVKEGQLQPAT